MRLTPIEHKALDAMVAKQQAELDAMGVAARVSGAGILRALLKREAMAKGCWPNEQPVVAAPPAPKHDTEADLAAVLAAARANINRSNGFAYIPATMRACVTSGITIERAHSALLLAADRKVLELRPDRLTSDEDHRLCPPAPDGHAGFAWARFIDANISTPAPTPSAQIDPDALRRRIKKANKAGHSYASIADAAGINRGTFSGFTGGRPLGADKVAELDATLRSLGF
jgi:hypothetical protein